MGTNEKNLLRQAMNEIKTFNAKETSYSEIISAINHMINKVVNRDSWKDHYVINVMKDDQIFIIAGDVNHYVHREDTSFMTINTLNTAINEVYASKPKDILKEIERRLKDFLDDAPQSLEERVAKLEEIVYGNKDIKKEEYENELVQKVETIYHNNILIDTLKMLSKAIKESIDRINRKEYTGCKKGELILVKRNNTDQVLFAIYVCTSSCGDLHIYYTTEYENIGDIEDLVCFRTKKQWFHIDTESVNNTTIENELLQSFISKVYDTESASLTDVKINNEDDYYKFSRLLINSIIKEIYCYNIFQK